MMRNSIILLLLLFFVFPGCSKENTKQGHLPDGVSQETNGALFRIGNGICGALYRELGSRRVFSPKEAIELLEDNLPDCNAPKEELICALRAKEQNVHIAAAIVLWKDYPYDEEVKLALVDSLSIHYSEFRKAVSLLLADMYPEGEDVIRAIIHAIGNSTAYSEGRPLVQILYGLGPGIIPLLIEGLDSNGIGIKQVSAIVLGMHGPESMEAVPGLIRNVKDRNFEVRIASINALAVIGKQPGVVEALTEAAYGTHHQVSNNAIVALTYMGREGINVLIEMVDYAVGSLDAQGLARKALNQMVADDPTGSVQFAKLKVNIDPDVIPALVNALNSDDADIQGGALRVLLENDALTKNELPFLLDATVAESYFVKLYAAKALKSFSKEPGVIDALISLLDDSNRGVRKAAAEVLGEIGPESGVIPILSRKLKTGDKYLIKETAEALGHMGPDAVQPLIEIFYNAEGRSRAYAAYALGFTGPEPGVLDTLVDALNDEDSYVRHKAIEALGNIGAPAGFTLPLIRQMYRHEPWDYWRKHLSRNVESIYVDSVTKIVSALAEDERDQEKQNNPGS